MASPNLYNRVVAERDEALREVEKLKGALEVIEQQHCRERIEALTRAGDAESMRLSAARAELTQAYWAIKKEHYSKDWATAWLERIEKLCPEVRP